MQVCKKKAGAINWPRLVLAGCPDKGHVGIAVLGCRMVQSNLLTIDTDR